MIIRCDKCSTVYELDDRLIPSGGAPVQCSRCEHVFRAYPEKKPEPKLQVVPPAPEEAERTVWQALPGGEPRRTLTPVPAPTPPAAVPVPTPVPTPPAALAVPTPVPAPTPDAMALSAPSPEEPSRPSPRLRPPASEPRPADPRPATPVTTSETAPPGTSGIVGMTADGRPIRKVPNPELEGQEPPPLGPPRRPVSYEVGPRKPQSGRWAIAGAGALVVGLGILGSVLAYRERKAAEPPPVQAVADPTAARVRQDGVALLARDDAASLERGAALLDEAVRKEKSAGARADRALSLALLSQEARDDADRLAGRARVANDERAAAEAAGDASRARSLAADAESFQVGVTPARERAGRLAAEAKAELDALPPEKQRDPIVLRARAMAFVAAGQRAEASRIARDARGLVQDAWLDLAGVLADLPENAGADEHARALDRLEKLAAARPELVRARYLAARIRAGIGDSEGALTALDAVLQANPEHLEAKRLRAEIAAQLAPLQEAPPPPTADLPPAQLAPAEPATPEKPGSHDRKAETQRRVP